MSAGQSELELEIINLKTIFSNYSDPQLYTTSHSTFPDIEIGGSGTFQSQNSMMEFYEHHSQFNNLRSTNQNRELITRNNNHLDQSAVSVPTQLLTSKRLDLLSEHPEKNLSQNLFNKNSYQVKRFDRKSKNIKDRVFFIDDSSFSVWTVYFLKK